MKAYTKGRKKVNWHNFVLCHLQGQITEMKCTNQEYGYLYLLPILYIKHKSLCVCVYGHVSRQDKNENQQKIIKALVFGPRKCIEIKTTNRKWPEICHLHGKNGIKLGKMSVFLYVHLLHKHEPENQKTKYSVIVFRSQGVHRNKKIYWKRKIQTWS